MSEIGAIKIIDANVGVLAINVNKNYFTFYDPECKFNTINENLIEEALVKNNDLKDELIELGKKLSIRLENIVDGNWPNQYDFLKT